MFLLFDGENAMMSSLYVGATGMKSHSEGMQSVSNNIANVNTIGYKQQHALFADLMYETLNLGSSMQTVNSQRGMGSALAAVRTIHTEGSFEPGSAMTDLAISGKGFFEVTDDKGNPFYTRAGNFRFQDDGTLRDPNGHKVSGIAIKDGKEVGGVGPININFFDPKIASDPPKASSSLTALMNINVPTDKVTSTENPYFAMLQAWDGTQKTPLSSTEYSQPLTFYDEKGTQHTATVRFDAASTENGQKTIEYMVTIPPDQDGRANADGTPGAGLLMSGTMTFSSSGQLINMSAFTPGEGDLKDLANWTPATLDAKGVPQFTVNIKGNQPQTLSLNIGVSAGGGWDNAPASAADVGKDRTKLPGMANTSFSNPRTTGLPVSSALNDYKQDGYSTGNLNDVEVDTSGVIIAHYSNGQSHEIYRIPVSRFTSEDGLRREGNNLYSATRESGNMEYGTAGTENYGSILGSQLETSNVDMSQEMVNMIIIQRGFQSNSKTITTADAMLQKAMELKRS